MTVRASRVLPGVLVSVLLAAPAFAATPSVDQLEPARHHHRSAAHKPSASTAAAATPVRRHARKPAAMPARAGRPSHPADPTATAQSAAFIDDTFSYGDPAQGQPAWKQSGVASWYGGPRWQGHLTSSGARYNENALTAAHATLPMGSRVKVKLHHSDKEVVVVINDRPGTRTRIIDLSRGAAQALGILHQGVAMVTLLPADTTPR